jgi:hypothetical protein
MIDPPTEDRPTCRHCGHALGYRDLVCSSCGRVVLHTGTTAGAVLGVLLCILLLAYFAWRELAE